MENSRKKIEVALEALEALDRTALEQFFMEAALLWGWNGLITVPIRDTDKSDEYLLKKGQLYRLVTFDE